MEKIAALKDCVDKITKDAFKFFEKNNKAAGVRARKKLQKCKKYAQEIRNLIQKSKQEHVQKKAAAAANAAALNSNNFIQNSDPANENANIKTQPVSYINDSNYLFLQEKELCKPFLKESVRTYNIPKSIIGLQSYARIDSLPPLNEEKIDILR